MTRCGPENKVSEFCFNLQYVSNSLPVAAERDDEMLAGSSGSAVSAAAGIRQFESDPEGNHAHAEPRLPEPPCFGIEPSARIRQQMASRSFQPPSNRI